MELRARYRVRSMTRLSGCAKASTRASDRWQCSSSKMPAAKLKSTEYPSNPPPHYKNPDEFKTVMKSRKRYEILEVRSAEILNEPCHFQFDLHFPPSLKPGSRGGGGGPAPRSGSPSGKQPPQPLSSSPSFPGKATEYLSKRVCVFQALHPRFPFQHTLYYYSIFFS